MGRERKSAVDHSSGSQRTCLLDRSAWAALVFYLQHFPHTEMFGLGIGIRREDGANVVLGTIWPKQEARSATFCQMKITDLGIIIPCIVDIRERHGISVPIGIAAWVHTHPNLSVFLSGTDRDTYGNWSEVDPGILAVVIDVFHRHESYLAFSPDFSRTGCELYDHTLTDQFALFFRDLASELPDHMRAAGRPLEALIMPDKTTLFRKFKAGEYEPYPLEVKIKRDAGLAATANPEPTQIKSYNPKESPLSLDPMEARAWLHLMDSLRRLSPPQPLLALPVKDPGAFRPGVRLVAFPGLKSPANFHQAGHSIKTLEGIITKLTKEEFNREMAAEGDRFLAVYPPAATLAQTMPPEDAILCNPLSLMPLLEEFDKSYVSSMEEDHVQRLSERLSQAMGMPVLFL